MLEIIIREWPNAGLVHELKGAVDERASAFERRVEERFAALDRWLVERLAAIDRRLDDKLSGLDERIASTNERFDQALDVRERPAALEAKVEAQKRNGA